MSIDFQHGCPDNSLVEKKSLEQMVLEQLDISCKRMKLGPFLTQRLKWTTDLNRRPTTMGRLTYRSKYWVTQKTFLDNTPKA